MSHVIIIRFSIYKMPWKTSFSNIRAWMIKKIDISLCQSLVMIEFYCIFSSKIIFLVWNWSLFLMAFLLFYIYLLIFISGNGDQFLFFLDHLTTWKPSWWSMSLGSRSKAMGFIHLAFEDIRDKGKWQRKRRETREPDEEQKSGAKKEAQGEEKSVLRKRGEEGIILAVRASMGMPTMRVETPLLHLWARREQRYAILNRGHWGVMPRHQVLVGVVPTRVTFMQRSEHGLPFSGQLASWTGEWWNLILPSWQSSTSIKNKGHSAINFC